MYKSGRGHLTSQVWILAHFCSKTVLDGFGRLVKQQVEKGQG